MINGLFSCANKNADRHVFVKNIAGDTHLSEYVLLFLTDKNLCVREREQMGAAYAKKQETKR